ncbi:Ribonuclease T2 [Penicillium argentinense]|uniref:ribonuclease T2 n=1 Tax=Penicillium argentinense TaxID=1131581 RepID=A0A9W9FH28_9EURO|nr:Ribonuclease T2 [Penicillium argentinense]KAJ5100023.1 Ribonuclease T2 [Penicillium argentinense]
MAFVHASVGVLALATFLTGVSADLKTCSRNNSLSCHSSSQTGTCCYNYPGGALLQTQFWDTDPSTGPSDSWTIHGLWPDNCDGTYESNCDESRAYTNITDILEGQNRTDLLDYMKEYWVDIDGKSETFWAHEWGKHGTCVNTIKPNCYTNYSPQEEVGEFFQKTVDLFKGLDTYQALSAAGITPDESKTYTSNEIISALSDHHGAKVYIDCTSGKLNQVWYFFNVRGNAINGQYQPTDTLADNSKCPSRGIKYLPKSN